MRRATICIVTMLVALAGLVAGARAATTPARPAAAHHRAAHHRALIHARIRRALTRAERSRYLWATVNICRSHGRGGGLIGIRGEMTALGFRSTLSMRIRLRQYDPASRHYVPLKGSTAAWTQSLGPLRRGVHQDGAAFRFTSSTGLLDARVTFTWMRDGRRLGSVTRTTTSGHRDAAFAQPAHHSAAHCRL